MSEQTDRRLSDGNARQMLRDWPEVPGLDDLVADLLDARATIAERDAEIVRLCAKLTAAKSEAWKAGRDAAADAIQHRLLEGNAGTLSKNTFGYGRDEGLEEAERLVRRLTAGGGQPQ